VAELHPEFMDDLARAVGTMDFDDCFDKENLEAGKAGRTVLSPIKMNQHFKNILYPRGYKELKSKNFYPERTDDALRLRDIPHADRERFLCDNAIPYRQGSIEGDFHRRGVLLEVQFGKYPFVDWDIDKALEFRRRGLISAACVLVPMPSTLSLMSSGPASWQTSMTMFYDKKLDRQGELPIALVGVDLDLSGPLPTGVRRPKPSTANDQLMMF